jgi:hypothetical protein
MTTYLLTCQFTQLTNASSCSKPKVEEPNLCAHFSTPKCGRPGTGGPVYIDSSETKSWGGQRCHHLMLLMTVVDVYPNVLSVGKTTKLDNE